LGSAIRRAEALPAHLKQAALQALERLPGGDALCHGDFHPDNVIMLPRGPVIIDWIAATSGNPLGDVARTSLLLRLGDLPPGMPGRKRIEAMRSRFHRTWLQRYLQLRPASRRELAAWELPVAAARLNEDIPGEQTTLLGMVEAAVSGH
jgi:aminoglycoside phosphotransferase (APT) family kinase protein